MDASTTKASTGVEVAHSARELDLHEPAWEELAQSALEPNPFYEPWMLRPAVDLLCGRRTVQFVFVYRHGSRNNRQLIGFFPCELQQRHKGLPVRVLKLWKHLHCFLCTPLLHAEHAPAALRELVRWSRDDSRAIGLIDFAFVHAGGRFQQALVEYVREVRHLVWLDELWNRALIQPAASADEYLGSVLSGSRRSEMRRLRRRLAELGRLETRVLQPDDRVDQWIEQFLALESAGWKGAAQTALATDQAQREYFTIIARSAFKFGRIQMLGLFLDDRPIALKCNFLAGNGSFAFKIAFDESFAKFSPGVLLELDNIRELHRQPELCWMDSCAMAGHSMIDRLWGQRRTLQSLVLSTGRWSGDLAIGILPLLRTLRRRLRFRNPNRAPEEIGVH